MIHSKIHRDRIVKNGLAEFSEAPQCVQNAVSLIKGAEQLGHVVVALVAMFDTFCLLFSFCKRTI